MDIQVDRSQTRTWSDEVGTPPAAVPTVLCVDDEPNVVSALARVFRRDHFRVLTAEGAREALALLEREPVAVVISDMRMPGMEGVAFLEEVAGRWPRTARILLTGYADLKAAVAAINRGGIFRYLFKPWDDDEVRNTVRHALEALEAEEERRRRHAMARRQNAALAVSKEELEDRVAERTEELRGAERALRDAFAALDAAYVTTVRLFASLAETGIDPNRGHGCRVADRAQRMAVALGFDRKAARDVLFAGLLHDIGKIALPVPLRGKPEAHLSRGEAAQVQRHSVVGAAMLMGLPPLREAARLIRHHHERMDGSGYPDGIQGADIPLGARIIVVASDFDALCSGSIFGDPMAGEDAVRFMTGRRETWYDSGCLDAFLAVTVREAEEAADTAGSGPARLRPADLRSGMVLAADLVAEGGIVLLTRDRVLDPALIEQLGAFERESGWTLAVPVVPEPGGAL